MLLLWATPPQSLYPSRVIVGAQEPGACYPLDTIVQVNATFLGENAPADPSSAVLFIKTPDGMVNRYAPTRLNVGVYEYQFVTDQSGPWIYKWQGTGAVEVTSSDVYCIVQASAVLAG